MEPPAKKRRQAPSLFDDDEDDDDELFFQPQEVSARRDPGYKLSVKRACADHKLQTTMAHIIEKYSHDFEGIGDEIDMETGEIVVNNGHLTHMRNEGDIGTKWQGDEDEDEGVRLEDLSDEFPDNERESDAAQDSEDDEDMIMKGKEVLDPNTAMITSRSGQPAPPSGKLSSLLITNLYGRNDPFGPPPAFGASPFAYGNSALSVGSRGWSSGLPTSGYGHMPTNHAPPQRLSLTAGNSMYEFPAQEGYKSIWASGNGYDEDWALRPTPAIRTGFRKQVAKYPVKPQPQKLLDAPKAGTAHVPNDEEDDEDEDAIVTGRSSQVKTGINVAEIGESDDEDSLLLSNPRSLATPPKSSPIKDNNQVVEERKDAQSENRLVSNKNYPGKRKRQALEETPPKPVPAKKQLVAMKTKKVIKEIQDTNDRRRSGRFKKQTEFMGKICWAQADGTRKTMETLTVELMEMDPERRKDFQSVDKVADEENPIPETTQDDSMSEVEVEEVVEEEVVQEVTEEADPGRIIPNSQDTGTPLTSSAPPESQMNTDVPKFPGITKANVDTTFVLSDDEAPIILPEPRGSKQPKPSAKRKAPEKLPEAIPDPILSESYAEPSEKEHGTPPAPARKPGRPPKVTLVTAPTPTSQLLPEDSHLNEATSASASSRRLGRPKKETIVSESTPVSQTRPEGLQTAETISDQPRKLGRPSKATIVSSSTPKSQLLPEDSQLVEATSAPHRKPGRPRKDTVIPAATSILQAPPEDLQSVASTSDAPRRPGRPKKAIAVSVPTPVSPALPEELEVVETTQASLRKPGRPRKTTVVETPATASPTLPEELEVAETTQASIRKPGRPRKATVIEATTPMSQAQPKVLEAESSDSIKVSPSVVPSPKERRKPGRPRKSDVSISIAESPAVEGTSGHTVHNNPGESTEVSNMRDAQVTATVDLQVDNPSHVDKPDRMGREIRWLQKQKEFNPKATDLPETWNAELPIQEGEVSTRQLRSVRSRELVKSSNDAPSEIKDSQEESSQALEAQSSAPEPELPPLVPNDDPFDLPEDPPTVKLSPNPIGQPSATPRNIRIRDYPSHLSSHPGSSPSSRSKTRTPRHTHIRTTHAPSSRRSILSLLSDDDEDRDELGREVASSSQQIQSSGATMRKLWRSSALTTEIQRTPVKKRPKDPASSGSVVKTPGGTTRMCGVDGYRCQRDFCFTCL